VSDILDGRLAFAFIVSILDAVLLSLIGLWLYRRAVHALMGGSTGVAPSRQKEGVQSGPRAGHFALRPAASERPPRSGARLRAPHSRRVSVAYGLGAALHAGVITAFDVAAEPPPSPLGVFAKWWIYTWPILPTLFALHVLDGRGRVRALLQHVAAGAAAMLAFSVAWQLAVTSLSLAAFSNVAWMLAGFAFTAAPPFALVWLSGWRRVRAVTPVALAATLVFGFGLIASMDVLIFAADRASSMVLGLSGATSVRFVRYAPFLLMSLPLGGVAWAILRALARGYARKRFSDVQLVIDCWWVIVTAEQVAVVLARSYGPKSLLIGALAFGVYRVGVGLALAGARRAQHPGRRLLLLRVFGYQRRTEALFDRVAQRWRDYGPVQLIGGVDLAARTIDPGDIWAFLGGRLSEQCIATPEQIEPRIAALDGARDPDGRFRVNEIYCRSHTWRAALQRLLGVTDLVLMDLRTFSAHNDGCEFELQQLLRQLETDQVLVVCDRTTDIGHLELVLDRAWLAAQRDGQSRGAPHFRVCRIERQSARELNELFQTLLEAGGLDAAEGRAASPPRAALAAR
jgi:hypothetical protein